MLQPHPKKWPTYTPIPSGVLDGTFCTRCGSLWPGPAPMVSFDLGTLFEHEKEACPLCCTDRFLNDCRICSACGERLAPTDEPRALMLERCECLTQAEAKQ